MVKSGRYGPYVSHDGVNATLPGGVAPDSITLEQAIGLIDARAEKTGGAGARRKRPARQQAMSRAATPKTAAKPSKRAAARKAKVARKPKAEAAE